MKKLSISIPTYNRKKILIENLEKIIKIKGVNQVDIFIFDDGDDGLDIEIYQILKENTYIKYIKNQKRHGHDENIKKALTYPDSEYVWLLGDSMIISDIYFNELMSLVNNYKYDAIILDNEQGRIKSFNIKNPYSDIDLYLNFGWHCTLTGIVIYSKKVIKSGIAQVSNISYQNFMQFAILFLGINEKSSLYIINKSIVCKNHKRTASYWVHNPLEVFARDWTIVNLALTVKYGRSLVFEVIRSHAKKTKLFRGKMLIYLKANGGINNISYRSLNSIQKSAVDNESIFFLLVLYLPIILFLPILKAYKFFKIFKVKK